MLLKLVSQLLKGTHNMDASLVTLIVGLLGGGTVATLVQFFVKRKDDKTAEFAEIKKELEYIRSEIKESQRDRKRQQLLTMMYHNPSNIDTICEIARVYFKELDGNWYMDSEFIKWAGEQNIPLPSWFKKK